MKRSIITVLLTVVVLAVNGQGAGFGYTLDVGGSGFEQPGTAYDQSYFTTTHNWFIRFHNRSGNNALQLMMGFRKDTIPFNNRSEFMSPDGISMMQYNTSAYLRRNALKFSVINQMQVGRPGRIVVAINTGLFCEHTLNATRVGLNNDHVYELDQEINYNNFGGILGIELRLACFTLGYKYEQLFSDILDHEYIISQQLSLSNSSELRGLVLNPPMHYLCLGINLDFFCREK
jgi:hypothetical protein